MKFASATTLLLLLLITAAPAEPVSWQREVIPVLRANCISCHKPGKTKGGLDLTTHAAVMKGGKEGTVVKPGDAKTSALIESVCGDEPDMPKEGEPLSPAEVDTLTRWINEGAKEDAPGTGPRRPAQPVVYTALPAVHAMAFSPDGNLLAIAGRYEIILQKADGSGIVARLAGDSPRLESLTFSKDGATLAACGGAVSEFGEIQIWDVAKREQTRSLRTGTDSLYGVALSSDRQRVAAGGGSDKLVRVFTLSDGKEIMRCDNHIDWVFGTAFTNDGQRLATVSRDKAAKLIDIATGRLIDDINRPRDPLICLARHPKDDLVATGGTDGRVRLFKMEPRGGRLSEGDDKEHSFVREYDHIGSPIQSIAFSADGALIACSGQSGEVRVFKTENSQRLAQIKGTHGPVFALSFTADGKQLAAAGADGRIRLYDPDKGALLKEFDSVPRP